MKRMAVAIVYKYRKCKKCHKLSLWSEKPCPYCLNNTFHKKRYDEDGFGWMFKTKNTLNGQGKSSPSKYMCFYCGKPIPEYRTKGNIKYRPWFCSSNCSKYVTPKITYVKLKPLKERFLKDGIPLRNYMFELIQKERNK